MTVEGGNPQTPGPRGTPRGTIVTVRDLFFNVPARLKFLKSSAAEAAHVTALVQQYALAYPAIRFLLTSDGKQVFASPGNGDLRDAIRQVYGQDIAQVMLPVGRLPATRAGPVRRPLCRLARPGRAARPAPRRAARRAAAPASSEEDEQGVQVWGYVSPPAVSRTNRQAQHFFVNGRAIGSRMLAYALEEAYHSLLMVGRHPIAVLNVRWTPPRWTPTSTRPRARSSSATSARVFVAVQKAVRDALSAHSPVPSFGSRGAEGWELPGADAAPAGARGRHWRRRPVLCRVRARPAPARQPGVGCAADQADLFGGYAAPALSWAATGAAHAPALLPAMPRTGPERRRLRHGRAGAGAAGRPAPLGPLPSAGTVAATAAAARGGPGLEHLHHHRGPRRHVPHRPARRARAGALRALRPRGARWAGAFRCSRCLQPLTLDLTARQRAEIEPVLPLLHDVGFDVELVRGRAERDCWSRAVPAMYADRVSLRRDAGDGRRTAGRQPARPLARPTGDHAWPATARCAPASRWAWRRCAR